MLLVSGMCLLGCLLIDFVKLKEKRSSTSGTGARTAPISLLIINMYTPIPDGIIKELSSKYNICIKVQNMYKASDYKNNHKEFCKLIGEYSGEIPYEDIVNFVSKNKNLFPDLVVLCSNTSVFKTASPFLLYSAEALHFRKTFSEAILKKALLHYSTCEIRNGK